MFTPSRGEHPADLNKTNEIGRSRDHLSFADRGQIWHSGVDYQSKK